MTTRGMRAVAFGLALAIAAPAIAADTGDVKDTATEQKAKTKKKARSMKPGGETAKDKMNDAGDTAKEQTAKAKKKGRKAHRKASHQMNETKQDANNATK